MARVSKRDESVVVDPGVARRAQRERDHARCEKHQSHDARTACRHVRLPHSVFSSHFLRVSGLAHVQPEVSTVAGAGGQRKPRLVMRIETAASTVISCNHPKPAATTRCEARSCRVVSSRFFPTRTCEALKQLGVSQASS